MVSAVSFDLRGAGEMGLWTPGPLCPTVMLFVPLRNQFPISLVYGVMQDVILPTINVMILDLDPAKHGLHLLPQWSPATRNGITAGTRKAPSTGKSQKVRQVMPSMMPVRVILG